MGRPKKDPSRTANLMVAARLTETEHAVLMQLLARRAAESGDDTFARWLRWLIRREAKEAGLSFDGIPAPKKKTSPRAA